MEIDTNSTKNLGLYVDCDNSSHRDFENVLDEVKKQGRLIVKRIYGDWTKSEMKAWKEIAIENALEPINCFNLSKKNSTDIKLICDILEDLYNNKNLDIFIIVSSDSDYSNVTQKIRSEGKIVIGIGKRQTPKKLVNSCDKFIFTENLKNNIEDEEDDDNDEENENKDNNNLLNIIFKSFFDKKIIRISTLKKNLISTSNIKQLIKNDDFNHFDKYLEANFSNIFKIKTRNRSVFIINKYGLENKINCIIENSKNEEINLSLINDKLLLEDSSFDIRTYGFQNLKQFISELFPNNFILIKSRNGVYVKRK